jgi:hypothetical protein
MSPHDLVPDPRRSQGATAMGEVRNPVPWNWEGLGEDAVAERRRLSAWVSRFVARYVLEHEVPPCWWRHAELANEFRALWYYLQAVTAPLVHVVFTPEAIDHLAHCLRTYMGRDTRHTEAV